jgi:hypothetical protein
MSQIDDFSGPSEYSLDDFTTEPAAVAPVTSLGSNKNMAAHAALLTPGGMDPVQVYNQGTDELGQTGTSQTISSVVANAQGETLAGYKRAAADLLTDPNATDEWKLQALDQINNPQNTLFNSRAMVASRAAEAPVKGEANEAADLRGLFASSIQDVLNYQREKQRVYNEIQLKMDANKAASYVGAAEDFIPTVSGYKEARINADLLGNNSSALRTAWDTVWAGTTKADRRDWFNRIPLEDRARAMEKVMDIVGSNGQTILLPEEMDNANMAAFRDAVEQGSYTSTDETIDNILGVLDIVGVGSILRGAGKSLLRGAEGLGEAGEATAKGATAGGPRRPTPGTDWKTGNKTEPGVYDQEGNPSYAVREWELMTPVERSWTRRYTISDVQPTSPSQTIKDANPEMARNLHGAVENDQTGDVANALYGAGREDAIAHDIAPQVSTVNGSVQSKVHHTERNSDFAYMPDAEVMDFADNSGALWFSQNEKYALRSQAVNDFTNATGFNYRKEMSSVEDLPDGVTFKSVLGPSDSGWGNIDEAVTQATFALRNYGLVKDDVKILTRVGDEYHPVSLDEAAKNPNLGGDFLLQVNHTHKFSAGDMVDEGWEAFDVKRNLMDSWAKGTGKNGQGSLASNLLDPQSMLHFDLTKGATVSGSRGAQLEVKLGELTKDYITQVKKLPSNEQKRLFSKIREANVKGESYNYVNMKAEGFSDDSVKALESWKTAQDTIYALSNRDMVRSYKNRGYGLMEHPDSGTRLFVKELPRNSIADGTMVYDPVKGDVRRMSKEEIGDWYGNNGNISRSVNPMEIDGVTVEHVLNHNSANGTYVRALNDYDQVLNYRKGYYAVRYENPHFIERKMLDENGKPLLDEGGRERWRAVATADTVPNAKRAIDRLTATKGGEYRYRADLKGENFDASHAQSLQAGGMSAQRVRGERLEEGLGSNMIDSDANIEAPINSLIHSASSISHRVAHRDWLETAKARFMAQYDEVLPKKQGRTQFPSSRADIGTPGMDSKMARDARTTYEYIRQMENGFINSIDDGYKAMFNALADSFGAKGMGTIEKGLRSVGGAGGPTVQIKSLAFNLLLALNPLRQFLVQSHQALMLCATFPLYGVSHMVPDLMIVLSKHLAEGRVKLPDTYWKQWGRTPEQAEGMWQALKKSGIAEGIKQHELTRSGLNSLADSSAASRFRMGKNPIRMATSAVRGVAGVSRKIGFDFGEYLSSSASFLAHYDDAVKKGVKMDNAGIEETFAKSRNYVYNMDRAGAMPYNHNNVAMFTQFLQVPHKALTQLMFNRGISPRDRQKMFGFMTAMFGPTAVIGLVPGTGDAIDNFFGALLPEDPVARDALRTGLETYILNKAFTEFYGQDVSLDYSSLAPLDAYGITEFIGTAFDEGITKLVTNSPGGSLLFGTNPRVTQVLSTMGSLMGMGDAKEQDPTKWSNMWLDIANTSSGFSNAMKAKMMLEYGKKIGNLGGTTDQNVNSFEAIAQAFGVPTKDSESARKILDSTWKTQESFDKDVKSTFQKYAKLLVQDGLTADQFEYTMRMAQIEMGAYGNNDRASKTWQAELKKQQTNGDNRIIEKVLEMSGWAKPSEVRRLVDQAPGLTEEQRTNLRDLMDYNFSMRSDLNPDNKVTDK